MQRVAAGPYQKNNHEYDRLLAQAVRLGHQHETRAKDFVPKMYEVLVKREGLEPYDAVDRIYKDLVGIWQKDTIRRLLPAESKNQVAREMQALRQFPLESNAGLILREKGAGAGHHGENDDGAATGNTAAVAALEQENDRLRKAVEELENAKKSLLERALRLERLLAEKQQQQPHNPQPQNVQEATTAIVVLPPHLFMKAYALMRGSTRPLVLQVIGREAVDIDRMKI